MAQKWFVSRGDRIYGPWSTDDVFTHRHEGNVGDADVIWGAGQDGWMTIAKWNPEAAGAARPFIDQKPSAVRAAPAAESVYIQAKRDFDEDTVAGVRRDDAETVFSSTANEAWHYAVDGQSFGPFNRPNLLIELRRLSALDGVSLWTRGMREWSPIIEFHEISSELGLNQRKHARAGISGRAVLRYDGLTQVAPMASIGEGGMGLRVGTELYAGLHVTVEVPADALGAPLTLEAEVRYCAQGILGLKFSSLSGTARGLIGTYVKHAARGAAKAA